MITGLIYKAVTKPPFVIHGVRKIVQGLSYQENNGLPPPMDILKDLGYSKMKLTRLMNLYYNQAEVDKAKKKLQERQGEEHSSVSILTRNMEKTHPKAQGWCIQNITISQSWRRKECVTTADIFYRSTEAIMKFGADLSLIRTVFDDMEIDPRVVRFYFANLYVSAVFFPILFKHTDGVEFLTHIKEHDQRFWFLAAKAVSRYLAPVNRYNYRTQNKLWSVMQEQPRESLDKYLMATMGDYHKEHLPRIRKKAWR